MSPGESFSQPDSETTLTSKKASPAATPHQEQSRTNRGKTVRRSLVEASEAQDAALLARELRTSQTQQELAVIVERRVHRRAPQAQAAHRSRSACPCLRRSVTAGEEDAPSHAVHYPRLRSRPRRSSRSSPAQPARPSPPPSFSAARRPDPAEPGRPGQTRRDRRSRRLHQRLPRPLRSRPHPLAAPQHRSPAPLPRHRSIAAHPRHLRPPRPDPRRPAPGRARPA